MCQAVISLMRKNNYGRIVNVSTGAASHARGLAAGTANEPAYRVTKAALNALTRVMAAELKGTNILVNVMNPGWVPSTDMGSGGRPPGLAPTPIEQPGATAVWLATLSDDGPAGGFFQNLKPFGW
jgi:NAD(P)-dependent dehydrogenase (short-subunit alcohol dehydrogenase family)